MMKRFKVYLAGPIAGLTYDAAQDWRHLVKAELHASGIDGYSPLRNKDFLRDHGEIGTDAYKHVMAADRGIMARDHFDCSTADAIFVNLLGASKVSIGTAMEMAWGFDNRKPVIVAMEASGNVHDHPMIREAISYRVETLADAINITKSILLPQF